MYLTCFQQNIWRSLSRSAVAAAPLTTTPNFHKSSKLIVGCRNTTIGLKSLPKRIRYTKKANLKMLHLCWQAQSRELIITTQKAQRRTLVRPAIYLKGYEPTSLKVRAVQG